MKSYHGSLVRCSPSGCSLNEVKTRSAAKSWCAYSFYCHRGRWRRRHPRIMVLRCSREQTRAASLNTPCSKNSPRTFVCGCYDKWFLVAEKSGSSFLRLTASFEWHGDTQETLNTFIYRPYQSITQNKIPLLQQQFSSDVNCTKT